MGHFLLRTLRLLVYIRISFALTVLKSLPNPTTADGV